MPAAIVAAAALVAAAAIAICAAPPEHVRKLADAVLLCLYLWDLVRVGCSLVCMVPVRGVGLVVTSSTAAAVVSVAVIAVIAVLMYLKWPPKVPVETTMLVAHYWSRPNWSAVGSSIRRVLHLVLHNRWGQPTAGRTCASKRLSSFSVQPLFRWQSAGDSRAGTGVLKTTRDKSPKKHCVFSLQLPNLQRQSSDQQSGQAYKPASACT